MSKAMNNAGLHRILVVDDASANLLLLTNLLTGHGYTVHPASDGELALEFVRSILPDLILLDIRMPGMDGYEVCRRLKTDERTRSIPIIFISILEDERDKVKGFQAGGVDYISKPFQPEEVLARVRTHLSLRELAGNLEQKVSERTQELMNANQRLRQEIAERKRAEQSLQFTQFAIDNSIDQAFWMTEDARLFYVNEAACRTLGYTREELLQMSVPDIDPDFSAEVVAEHWRELKAKGSMTFESRHRAKDGRIYPVEIRANYMVFDGREYNCAFATDISERKKTEEALKLSQVMIDGASMGIFRGTEEARILFVNDYWARKLGYTPAELCSMTFFDLDPNLTPESWLKHREKLTATGFDNFESLHRCKDGTDIPVEVTVNLFTYRDQPFSCSFARDITERKQAENTLRQASLVLENSPAVVFHWGASDDWPVEMVSGNVTQFGYAPEELLSGAVPYAALVHPADLGQVVAGLHAQVSRGEDTFSQEYRIVTKQGEVRWVDERTLIERDADGRVIRYQGIVMDITERKQAEEALRESERKYRSIVEHAPFGITRSTKDGKMLSVNPALASILKYDSAQELMETINRTSIQDVLFPKPSEREPLVENILANDAWYVFKNRLRCKDGSIVTCRVHSRRIADEDGRATEFESFQENITDQLAAEQALRESEGKFRVLAETSPVAICIYRGESLVYANPAMERLFGYSVEELCRMKFWDLAQEDFKELIRARGLARLAGESVPGQSEARYVTKAGSEKYVLISTGVMEYQGRPTGVASFLDITERKEAEELIRSSLREKEVLLKEIHHRVKNNLQVVSSLLFLQAQKIGDPELAALFAESQNRIHSMALAHEQLYRSKNLADVRLPEYVGSLVEEIEQVFRHGEKTVCCRVDVDDIDLDIEQVVPCGLLITELLSNALRHAFPGSRTGTVRVEMHQQDGVLSLTVRDDGVGLPADLDVSAAGTLGLQLVRALTDQLDGTLEVARREGAEFRVAFPARNRQGLVEP
jgi:PAS domain S-box-containing protein